MSDAQVISNCKQAILEQVANHEGDILKSDLYKLLESEGESTDIAMAIKSLRDEGRIVVFGDGKTARIMSGSITPSEPKVIINNAVDQVTQDLIQTIIDVQIIPEGSRIMSPEFGEKIESRIDIKLPEIQSAHDTEEPVLPKQVPGNLSLRGVVANAAYCLFTAKTNDKYDALTLDIISNRLSFTGNRGTLNGAVDYLVTNGYVTKYRDGPKPVFYWSGKFSRPFERVGVIPEPIIKGSRSPFAPAKLIEKVEEVISESPIITDILVEEPVVCNEFEDIKSDNVSKYPSKSNELDIKIDETVNSINVLSKYLDSLLEKRKLL